MRQGVEVMQQFVIFGTGLLAVASLVFMLLKKYDIKITLFAVGIVLMYVAVAMGRATPGGTGFAALDPIMAIVLQFRNTLQGPGLVILILGGYTAYMNHIGANELTVYALTKPLKGVKSVYVLVPVVFLLGNLLSLVIPSASNLAIILLATLYPVLRTSGMSNLTAAGVIATTATVMPTPLGSDNVAVAAALGMEVTEYVFGYHAIVSIPTLLVMAVVHTFWQKFMDGRALKSGRISAVDLKFEDVKPVSGGAAFRVVYAILPLLPIIVLLGFFAVNSAFGTSLGMGVELVTLISFFIAICCEAVRHRNGKEVLAGTENFFKGMGNAMAVVALLVAASIFVAGLTSIGIIAEVQSAMTEISGAGVLLPVIMVCFTAVIVLLSGSGTALFFAMIPLLVPLAAAAGIAPVALSVPLGLSGNLLRAVSPVAAVVVIVAGATKENPMDIVKRTGLPMIVGTVFALILSIAFFVL